MKQLTIYDILDAIEPQPPVSDCSLSHGYESAEEFMDDVAEAHSKGYRQIIDADGESFTIIDETLISRDSEEDDGDDCEEPDTVEELDEETPLPMAKWQAAQLKIIDVINNTLDQKGPITPQQADTILTLAAARETLLKDKY